MFLVVLYIRETTQKDSSKVAQTIHSGSILLTYHTRVHGLMHLSALPQPATKRPGCVAVDEIHEFECRDSTQEMHTMTKVIQTFHENIKCGPEYVCTCCDQLWYQSSVRKC